jgi:hypothetical protein
MSPISSLDTREVYDLFALDSSKSKEINNIDTKIGSEPKSLDECIDDKYFNGKEMFSIVDLVRGQPQSNKRRKVQDLRPIVYVRFNTRLGKPKPITLRALLDSGGSSSLISSSFTKKLKLRESSKGTTKWSTPAGTLVTNKTCKGQFTIPELHDNRLIEWELHVTKNMGAYDMIIGRDMMQDLKIDIRFSDQMVYWDGSEMPFKDVDEDIETSYYIEDPESITAELYRAEKILDNDYQRASLEDVAKAQEHLTDDEQQKLLSLLLKYEPLFDGTLGKWTQPDYKIELKEGVKPYHARAFPVPRIHQDTLKKEVERLCEVGVLKRVNRSEWAAPTFIIPKKDGKVRFISDFRELNKRIKRTPYPMPNIQDMMLTLEGFQYATALDLNMGYYHVRLDPDSRKLCTIILPFGKFEYQRLPQGLCNGPDVFQEKMMELFDGMEYIRAYIDDLLVLTKGNYDDHLEKLEHTLQRLSEAGLKVNAPKSYFARAELEYLGYWITRDGIKPIPKKIQAIQQIAAPKNKKELRSFIGVVNYYRDMWVRRSHVLAPLANLTSKAAKWKWESEHEQAFRTIKNIIAREVMLAYPDFSKPFEIHTDASHSQLGAVISQEGKPIAFYSRKLNPAQTRYTTTERELLSIVETLKEFKNILLGHKIIVHTDHKNLVYKTFNTERVMRWRLILEEFGPELRYIKGEHNIVADALSRLEMMSVEDFDIHSSIDCFAADAEDFPKDFPLSYAQLRHEQRKDLDIMQEFQKYLQSAEPLYQEKTFAHGDKEFTLITRKGKIVVPKVLQKKAVEYYHYILFHPGETRMELTIGQHFYWKNMRETIKHVCGKCTNCQLTKPKTKKYGKLPEKTANIKPWETVCVDLIGPYPIGKGKDETILHAMTMIDPATGWFEIAHIPQKRADVVANIFETTWLTKYPWPAEVVLDRGSEFKREFEQMLKDDYGITRKPITTRNPQANAMVERAHATLQNMINSKQIRGKSDLQDGKWTGILNAVGFAMRATVHTTTRATPSQLVFGRDAMLNVGFEADWQYIKDRKQKLIHTNNARENKNRIEHTYKVGDRVLLHEYKNRKYDGDRYSGPHVIEKVYDNGTVKLQQQTPRGGVVSQTWNIRKLTPYKA